MNRKTANMKRPILLLAMAATLCATQNLFAWGRLGHATVAVSPKSTLRKRPGPIWTSGSTASRSSTTPHGSTTTNRRCSSTWATIPRRATDAPAAPYLLGRRRGRGRARQPLARHRQVSGQLPLLHRGVGRYAEKPHPRAGRLDAAGPHPADRPLRGRHALSGAYPLSGQYDDRLLQGRLFRQGDALSHHLGFGDRPSVPIRGVSPIWRGCSTGIRRRNRPRSPRVRSTTGGANRPRRRSASTTCSRASPLPTIS